MHAVSLTYIVRNDRELQTSIHFHGDTDSVKPQSYKVVKTSADTSMHGIMDGINRQYIKVTNMPDDNLTSNAHCYSRTIPIKTSPPPHFSATLTYMNWWNDSVVQLYMHSCVVRCCLNSTKCKPLCSCTQPSALHPSKPAHYAHHIITHSLTIYWYTALTHILNSG